MKKIERKDWNEKIERKDLNGTIERKDLNKKNREKGHKWKE